jgi:hypothetical protein
LAIERSLEQGPLNITDFEEEIEVEILNPEAVSMETEDGGMLIDFTGGEATGLDVPFDANLVEEMDQGDVDSLSSELVGAYLSDRGSRKEWEETYVKGLNQLGLKIEERTSPWEGACGVTHPILSEAVIRFQSQAISEIFPSGGPVRTKIVGKATDEKTKQAGRIEDYLNYLVTEVMEEYRAETEKMLFSLPLAGSAFRKVYWDPTMNRPCAMFVPSEDIVVSYGAPSLDMAERVTHVMKRSQNDVRKMQVSGFYSDVELGNPSPDPDDIQKKYDELTGDSPSYEFDNRYTLLEMHVDVDLAGFEDVQNGEETGIALPYVITIELGSRKILSIRRNWEEGDPDKMRRRHFVHYEYIPGIGFYGFGLVHMIGGLAKSATSLLRQLVDAGTLSNLPGGLKSRGLRIRGEDSPISPGEFRDVDVPGGAIRDNITFLPYKEPSSVLYQLLGNIVEEGRRFASLTDLKVSDMSNQAPVGTTLALLERSMKVMAAIQSRLHASMKNEFRILEDIVRDHTPLEYPYDLEGDEMMKEEDFDDRIDVLPVSDPNSATMAQRIMQYQAAMQLAETSPEIYDMPTLHRQMLEVLGIRDTDKIIPLEDEIPVKDPVLENMDIIRGQPVKAFLWQDHEAHIATHMAAAEDPALLEMLEKDPNAMAVQSALSAHVGEHLAFQYRGEIENNLGVDLPPPEEPLPDDVEVQLSRLVRDAAERLLQQHQMEDQEAQAQEQAEDPIIQMRQQELEIRRMEAEANVADKQARLQLDQMKAQERSDVELARIQAQERIQGAKIESTERVAEGNAGMDLVKMLVDARSKDGELSMEEAKRSSEMALKISELMLSAENMMRVEKTEGAKVGSRLMEKLIDFQKEMEKLNKAAPPPAPQEE